MSLFRWTGIDIGNYSIKIVQVASSRGRLKLLNLFSIRRDELVKEARATDPESLGIALAERLSNSKITVSEGAIPSSSKEGIIRYVRVPAVPPWRLKIIMEYEIAEIAGKTGEDITADYLTLFLPDRKHNENMLTLVGLAKNHLIQEKLDFLQSAGIGSNRIVPSCVALFNTFRWLGDIEADETTLIVDIGHENLDMVLQLNRDLLFARSIKDHGGKIFTEAVSHSTGLDIHEADQLKINEGTLDFSPGGNEELYHALQGAATKLSAAINSSIGYCRAQLKKPKLKVDRILLSGGGSKLTGLENYLSKTLKINVEALNPLERMDLSALKGNALEKAKNIAPEMGGPLGLAICEHPEAIKINLLPYEYQKKYEFRSRTVFMMAAAVILVIYIVLSMAAGVSFRSKATVRMDNVDEQLDKAKTLSREYSKLKENNAERFKVARTLQKTTDKAYFTAQLWNALNKHTPTGVTLLRYDYIPSKEKFPSTHDFKIMCYVDNSNRQAAQTVNQLIAQVRKLTFVEGKPKVPAPERGRNEHEWKITITITCK